MKNLYISACLFALTVLVSCKKEKDNKPVQYPATAEIVLEGFIDNEPTSLVQLTNGQLYVPVIVKDVSGFIYYGGALLDDSKTATSLVAGLGLFHTVSGKISGNVAFDRMDGQLRFF